MTLLRHLFLLAGTALFVFPLTGQDLATIAINDNRISAGNLQEKTLTLHMEMRKGIWHPEQEDGEGIEVYAFGENGKSLQIPGPTIRVPFGTTIHIRLKNLLPVPATVYGLNRKPGKNQDSIQINAGDSKEIRFIAGKPGTYLYWARTPDGKRGTGRVADAMLGGAFVVDSPDATTHNDRIFVLGRWNGPTRTSMNGKSWPYTERLNYRVGENVRWRIINASDLSHPMHLHGFHFTLEGEGNGEDFTAYDAGNKPTEFTRSAQIAQTFDMTWVPKEPGRWLYHCHRIPHMRLPVPLESRDIAIQGKHNHEHMHDMDSEYAGMGGMIMGITVTGESSIDTSTSWQPKHVVELSVGTRKDDPRFFELSLREDHRQTTQASVGEQQLKRSMGLTGPPIVLTQNQPTEIVTVNHLKEPTIIHWHGLEIESYYDGVHGWGGRDEKKTPAVLPGQSFSARMIPPRAGTFIYHTHWHNEAQLSGGIHGAMIVIPEGEKFNPDTDKSFIFSQSPTEPYGAIMVLMNGSPQPRIMRLKVGDTYRFRFMNITATLDNLRVSLLSNGKLVMWKQLAKDAVNVQNKPSQKADQIIAIGETYDFEYTATEEQELSLVGFSPNDHRRAVQSLLFIKNR